MTTKDRILCAFGFHGPLLETGREILAQTVRYGFAMGEPFKTGVVKVCSICNRDVRCSR